MNSVNIKTTRIDVNSSIPKNIDVFSKENRNTMTKLEFIDKGQHDEWISTNLTTLIVRLNTKRKHIS